MMDSWRQVLGRWLSALKRAWDGYRRSLTQPLEQAVVPQAGEGAWLERFIRRIFSQYHFTPEAAAWLLGSAHIEVEDRTSQRGGGWWIPDQRTVRLLTAQDEAAVHELSHAWWHYRRQGQEDALIDAVTQAAAETDPRYSRVQNLAYGYVHGTPDGWKGMLIDRNDWEMFAGLASGTMGDTSLMPPYVRRFYEGLFQTSA